MGESQSTTVYFGAEWTGLVDPMLAVVTLVGLMAVAGISGVLIAAWHTWRTYGWQRLWREAAYWIAFLASITIGVTLLDRHLAGWWWLAGFVGLFATLLASIALWIRFVDPAEPLPENLK